MLSVDQITNILADCGVTYEANKWMRLGPVSIVYLTQDCNIFVGQDQLFRFNTKDELFEIAQDDHIAKLTDEQVLNLNVELQPYAVIPFSSLSGFITSSRCGPYGTYIKREF